MRSCPSVRQHSGMDDDFTDDDLLADLIRNVAIDVLERIGDDPEVRYQYFRAFVRLSRRTVDACPRKGEKNVVIQ